MNFQDRCFCYLGWSVSKYNQYKINIKMSEDWFSEELFRCAWSVNLRNIVKVKGVIPINLKKLSHNVNVSINTYISEINLAKNLLISLMLNSIYLASCIMFCTPYLIVLFPATFHVLIQIFRKIDLGFLKSISSH